MPRGKYVNHKGRSRHFTSPEELAAQESSSEEESGSAEDSEEGAEGAAGSSTKPKRATKKIEKKSTNAAQSDDSDEEDDDDEEEDRSARKGVAALIEIENPNRTVKKAAQKLQKVSLDEKPQLSRREREELEKQKARQRYEKLHAAGKTDEAKADLARLALIRQQRAEAAAKREAEKKAAAEKKGGAATSSSK